MKNQIRTDDVFAAALGNMNRQSKMAFMLQALQIAEQKHNQLDTSLNQSLSLFQQSVGQTVSELQNSINTALQKAEILESFELGQIEDAFAAFLSTPAMQALVADVCVTVNGQGYRLGSVVEAVAAADVDAKVEFVLSGNGEEISQLKYTLTDGTVVAMGVTALEDAENIKTYTVSTDNWKGAAATFEMAYKKFSEDRVVFGVTVPSNYWQPVSKSNIVFDLTGLMDACAEMGLGDGQVELNNDGEQGNA